MCANLVIRTPSLELDAPTTARVVGLPPRGGEVLSFEAKESTKESTRHGDSGKKASIAHFDGGARNVARNEAGQLTHTGGARSCSPFSAVKMGGPFSLRCLSPLCSAAAGTGQTQMALLGMSRCGLRGFAAQKNRLGFDSVDGINHTHNGGWNVAT